jgi:hypothetical protein
VLDREFSREEKAEIRRLKTEIRAYWQEKR